MDIKKPKIGELRHVGYFENNTGKIAYTAGYVDGYNTIVTSVRCKLFQRNTRKVDEFGVIEIVSSWEMICRFQSAIDQNIKINSKFVCENKRFSISGITVIDERNFFYFFNLNLINA